MSDIAIRVDHLGKPYHLGAKQHLNMTSSRVTATTVATAAVSLCLFGPLASIFGAQAPGGCSAPLPSPPNIRTALADPGR